MADKDMGDVHHITQSPKFGKKASYHHGDLHNALLKAAAEIIEEEGVENMSLRGCARRAGVSHGAPAHHFGDKAGIVTALAIQGYTELKELMEQYTEALESARGKLKGIGLAYIDFAVHNQSYFKIMFRPELCHWDNPELREASEQAFSVFEKTMIHYDREMGGTSTPNIYEKALLSWVSVHGVVSLYLDGPLLHLLNQDQIDIHRLANRVMTVMMAAFDPQNDV